MASSEPATDTKMTSSPTNDQSLKLAVAISLLRSKLLRKQPPPPPRPSNPPSETDALRWKRKAEERKQELLRLREDLREAEDPSQCDLFPQTALCKCYFFDNLGKISPKPVGDGSDCRFNDILRRRFLRQVRIKERRKRINNSNIKRFSDIYSKNEAEQLRAAVDFLVELCDTTSPGRVNYLLLFGFFNILTLTLRQPCYLVEFIFQVDSTSVKFCRWRRLILLTGTCYQ
uniref:Uncharacterized protein n=1 Tax=Salix viminalis TaxID=40686 RepID=A0A6N2MQY1_SALVM